MIKTCGALFAVLLVGASLAAASAEAGPSPTPALAGCPEFPEAVIGYLKQLPVDPHVLHEKRRRARHDMIEESPYDVCLHREWLALHGKAPESAASASGADSGSALLSPRAATVGTNVAPPTVLPPVGSDGLPSYQGETAISVDPGDPLRMVGHANTFYRDPAAACQAPSPNASKTYGTMALYGSNDGGVTWHYNCAPWPSDGTGAITGAAAFFGSDPALDWDSSGNAWAAYLLIDQNHSGTADGSGIAIAKSTDSGLSWSPVGMIVNNLSDSSLFEDKELMAIDRSGGAHDGRIYVIWDENNAERVAFSDSGATGSWTTVVLDSAHVCVGADIKVGADGTVYAVWNRLGFSGQTQTSETTVFAKSTNGGTTWTSAATVAGHRLLSFGSNSTPSAQNQRGVNAFPSLDVDRNSASAYFGRLYVTYNDFPVGTTSGNNLNVYLKASSNGGSTWTADPGVLVNDDGGSTTQFFPWLAVDPTDGTVNLAWYDTRNDAANNRKTQIFYARSSNGGASVEPNVLLTDGGANFENAVSYCDENSTDNASDNPNQYGDYSGISANFRQVHALWTDSRNFYPTSSDSRAEDVATTTLVNCSPPVWSADPSASCGASGDTVTWSLPGWGTNATGGTFSVNRFTDGKCTAGKTVVASGLSAGTTQYLDATASPGVLYSYSVTATNDCPGTALTPMSADSTCVVVASDLSPAITGPSSSCTGQQITLDAGAGYDSYSWSPGGATTQTISPSPSVTTTYTVTVTKAGHCPAAASHEVTVTSVPTAVASGSTTICAGSSTALSGSGGTSCSWSPSTGLDNASSCTPNASPSSTTTYTLTVSNGGCSSTNAPTVTINVNPKPTAVASGSNTICAGASTTLSGSGGTSCSWSPATGLDNASSCTPNASPSSTTTYTLTVTNASGCSSTNAPTATVTVNPLPTPTPATLPDGAVSVPYSQTIGSSTGTAPFSFAVVVGALPDGLGIDASTGQISGTPTAANDFAFTIRVTDAHGCFQDQAYSIHVTSLSAQALLLEGTPTFPSPLTEPNGVLESGETAAAAPSWRNAGPTTVSSVTGAASNFAGPNNGGVTYSITKGTASYGSIAAGATAGCGSDCYQLHLTASSRPAFHWDATFQEVLSNGDSHTWKIHVGNSFSDYPPSSTFYTYVEALFHAQITVGCVPVATGQGQFCPSAGTPRDQMAAFISHAETGSDAAVPAAGTVPGLGSYDCVSGGISLFSDVAATDLFCKHIHFIASRGITFGCDDVATAFSNPPAYCPSTITTRGTLAVFVARDLAGGDASVPAKETTQNNGNGRTYDCTDGQPNAFSDVSDSDPLCKYVYFIWWKNVIDGFPGPPPTYGATLTVTREQMSKYLTNAYGLIVNGP